MLKIKANLNYKSIVQYVFLFLLISFQKGAFARAIENNFLILVFSISLIFLMVHINLITKYSSFFIMLYLSVYLMIITMLTTNGSLSLMTIMRYIVCFLFAFICIKFDEKNLLRRYLTLVYIISIVSLVTYILFVLLHKSFYSMFYFKNGYYGLFLFNFNPTSVNSMRNIGISNEPGQFQIIVSSALYFSMFKYRFETQRKFIRYSLVFIITLISIQSTTGYFALIAILGAFVVSKSYNPSRKKVQVVILIFCLVSAVYIVLNWGESNFITRNFISKVFTNGYSINLNQNTGGARVESILTDLSMAKDHPFGLGFKMYEQLWYLYAPKYSGYLSCSGITRDIAIIGFLPVILFLTLLLKGLWINKISYLDFILGVFLIANTGFAQTQSLNPCLMLIAMYPIIPFYQARKKMILKINPKVELLIKN